MAQRHPGMTGFLSQVRSGRATVLFVFGTRPEAIKLAPLIKRLQDHPCFDIKVIVTSQHREMLDQVLSLFDIIPDIDLDIIQPDQTLFQIATRSLNRLEPAIMGLKPDLIVIQGDTLTTFCAALAASFLKIPVVHVEAGLRTGDKFNPFPEEISRVLTANIADWHFAPTRSSRDNLLREGIPDTDIFVTGNTVIDAVQEIARQTNDFSVEALHHVPFEEKQVLLVTVHRRESFGLPYQEICFALRDIVHSNPAVHILFSYHLNPNAAGPVREILASEEGVTLVPPLIYPDLIMALRRSWAVLTDSGGIQEEAPFWGKPVLVLREKTERPEAIAAGTAKLAGNRYDTVKETIQGILDDSAAYMAMSKAVNPYGDGKATDRIVAVLETGKLENPFC